MHYRKDDPYVTAIGDLIPPLDVSWRNVNFVGVTGHRAWAYFKCYGPLHDQWLIEWKIFYCDGERWDEIEWNELPVGIQFWLIRRFRAGNWNHSGSSVVPWDEGIEILAALESL